VPPLLDSQMHMQTTWLLYNIQTRSSNISYCSSMDDQISCMAV
jgi:hypothetical protein